MKIEELLARYFEGETSREEESELRRFFAEGRDIPQELQTYRPLFAFMDEEAKQYKATIEQAKSKRSIRSYFIYSVSGIAAALLLILGIAGINKHFNSETENYVTYKK